LLSCGSGEHTAADIADDLDSYEAVTVEGEVTDLNEGGFGITIDDTTGTLRIYPTGGYAYDKDVLASGDCIEVRGTGCRVDGGQRVRRRHQRERDGALVADRSRSGFSDGVRSSSERVRCLGAPGARSWRRRRCARARFADRAGGRCLAVSVFRFGPWVRIPRHDVTNCGQRTFTSGRTNASFLDGIHPYTDLIRLKFLRMSTVVVL
jgi:hypothetical protein